MITDYSKQMELIKPHEFTKPIHIIGVGALGSWIAFILLKMGFNNINVYDYDIIEEHNIPNQLFKESQIGELKIHALDDLYKEFFNDGTNTRLTVHNQKLGEDYIPMSGVFFCAVDSMKARKEIYDTFIKYNPKAEVWIEGRLSLYGAYVYTVQYGNMEQDKQYQKKLYKDEETEISACGVSQTALPSAINTASIMVMQMIEWINSKNTILNQIEYSIPWLVNMTKTW